MIQELDKLKKLYKLISTTFTIQNTNSEDNCIEINNISKDNKDSITLLALISNDVFDKNNSSSSEPTDINNKSLVN
ncbi:25021_t:CDS:2 [Cetraspora pellucida]|uniref:25021_t:CDS:1 n=1 Tax=Cetraspora pellucida TaxID=1433469 RepID=A0A9N9FGM1_9GLOM|nr:25021_t:CDS:2 [Cetraspora pellucida]